MARKKTTPAVEEEYYSPDVEVLLERVHMLPEEGNWVSLYRFPAGVDGKYSGRPGFCGTLTPQQFQLPVIQEWYGGGRFRAKFNKPIVDENGRTLQQFEFIIEGEPRLRRPATDASQSSTEKSPVVEVVEKMIEKQAKENDMTKMLLAIVLQQNKQPGGNSRTEILQELEALKGLASGASNGFQAKDMLEMFRSMLELAQSSAGGSEHPILSMILDKAGPLVERLSATPMVAVAPHPGQLPQSGGQPPPSPASISPPVERPKEKGLVEMFQDSLLKRLLLEAAANDGAPGLYAEMIVEHIPLADRAQTQVFLNDEAWFQKVCDFIPEARLQAAWWGELRETVLQIFNSPDKYFDEQGKKREEP